MERSREPVTKALKVLRHMVESAPDAWGLRELSRDLEMAPSSVHRILALLAVEGFVQQRPSDGRYDVGQEFYRLAWIGAARFPLGHVALPVMRTIVEACDETCLVSAYDRDRAQVTFVASVPSSHPLRYLVEIGSTAPVHAGASGLGILAFLPEFEREQIIARGLATVTDQTITEPQRLRAELARIRERGYALSIGQRTAGAVALSAPIRTAGGYVVGSLFVTVPEHRWQTGDEARIAPLVMGGARDISAMMAYRTSGDTMRAAK